MNVFVVNVCYDHEGEQTVGVFSSLEKAAELAESPMLTALDDIHVYEMPLDEVDDYSLVASWRVTRDWTNKECKTVKVRTK
jgi:hypothetical protein